MSRILVIGVGNPFRQDDGIGPVVIERLKSTTLNDVDCVKLSGDGLDLMSAWKGRDSVIIIDAIQSKARAGEIARIEVGKDPLGSAVLRSSTHSLGLIEAIELSRILDQLPTRLIIFGVEGQQMGLGGNLSPAVERAVPTVLAEIENELCLSRVQLTIKGAVQGVGFRPFVFRIASQMGIDGWVRNSGEGVTIEGQGRRANLEAFIRRIYDEKPAISLITSDKRVEISPHNLEGRKGFRIEASSVKSFRSAWLLPDMGTCSQCLEEMKDRANRRYRYPFINCTQCGPRYTIIQALPYDRSRTTMREFPQCAECLAEYHSPESRRFHAEPNACAQCGPHLEWHSISNSNREQGEPALQKTIAALKAGDIVAVKGIGGYHLMVDARNTEGVSALRNLKHRPEKPFALLYPSIQDIERDAEVSPEEASALLSWRGPIVLLKQKPEAQLSPLVACHLPWLGAMLPSNPLHHLLMSELLFPVVATSANFSGEPLCADDERVKTRFGDKTAGILSHNRKIERRVDDSIVRCQGGNESVLRLGRGYAPMSWEPKKTWHSALALGAQTKNSVAISTHGQVFLSAHVGDLQSEEALSVQAQVVNDYVSLYPFIEQPVLVADKHPDYRYARTRHFAAEKARSIAHHEAHLLSCLVDNGIEPPALGMVWDGSGYGEDGTVWGGEFLRISEHGVERVAHLRAFRLPGGEQAIHEPIRSAFSLLHELQLHERFSVEGLGTLQRKQLICMLEQKRNAPCTSSVGRLFDGVSSLLGLSQCVSFEAQAAMKLEAAALRGKDGLILPYKLHRDQHGLLIADWGPLVTSIMELREQGNSVSSLALAFHDTIAEMAVSVAKEFDVENIALTGGCFQNGVLVKRIDERLRQEGFRPLRHRRIPPNDEGIAMGQLAGISWRLTKQFPRLS